MCTRKKPYDTPEEAAQENQTVYECPYCKKFHRSGQFMDMVSKLNKKKHRA
jgi:hypothetical protein